MPYKICSHCNKTSYSASAIGIWICPYCGTDLTKIPEEVVIRQEKDSKIASIKLHQIVEKDH